MYFFHKPKKIETQTLIHSACPIKLFQDKLIQMLRSLTHLLTSKLYQNTESFNVCFGLKTHLFWKYDFSSTDLSVPDNLLTTKGRRIWQEKLEFMLCPFLAPHS